MPIFDQGYQHWSGHLSSDATRWLAITRRGVRTALHGRIVRLALILAYLPAILLVVGAAVVLTVVLLLFPGPLAQLFFGSARYSDLITPLPLLIFGGGLHGVAYGYLRGRSRIQRANMLVAINQALVPLIAIPLSGASVARILLLMGAGWTLAALAFLVVAPLSFDGVPERVRELARFGVPRVPGDLLRLALFSLPGVVVAHVADISVAGGVAFGVAAVGMLGTALSPIGFVMLPVAARMMAAGDVAELRRRVINIALVTSGVLVLGIVIVEAFPKPSTSKTDFKPPTAFA